MDVSNFSPNAQSSAVSATRDLPSSSGQLPAQNPSLQQEEVFYLILKYLNSFDALKDSAISLETNLVSHFSSSLPLEVTCSQRLLSPP